MDTRTTMKYATPILSWLLSCVSLLHSPILLAEFDWGALFANAGKANANKVAKWDGHNWITSESGMDDIVSVFTIDRSGNLHVEGELIVFGSMNAIGSGRSLDESNTQNNNVIGDNTEPEDTTSPTIEELFTQAKKAGIFNSIDATIEWLSTNGISSETLTKEQRNALPLNWGPPLTINNQLSDTAILSDKMGNEAVISIDNTVDVLLELTSSNELSDELIEAEIVKCVAGYVKVGSKLCLSSNLYDSARYRYAEYNCRQKHSGGRIADSADYFTVKYELGDESFNNYAIRGIWLGPRIADNQALYLNLVRWWDMDGQTSVFDFRHYRCAYDL